MTLVVENEVQESREQIAKAGLIVGDQIEVRNQVFKIIEMVMVMVMAFLQQNCPLFGDIP